MLDVTMDDCCIRYRLLDCCIDHVDCCIYLKCIDLYILGECSIRVP